MEKKIQKIKREAQSVKLEILIALVVIEVLTDIFQTCYQEDSRTLELVEDKLSKLKENKDEDNKHKK